METSWTERGETRTEGSWSVSLRAAVDFGLLAILCVAPLFMGGRGPIGKFVLLALVSATVGIWLLRQCFLPQAFWRRSGVEWLLLAGGGLVLLQLIPLPPSILGWLSPFVAESLPLWSSHGAAPFPAQNWTTVSLYPDATRGGLAMFFAYALLFLLIVQRVRETTDLNRLLTWIALTTIALAFLGMLQFLVGNGKFLWLFDHPSRTTFGAVKGPFHNQNHFAHMMALGIGPLIWAICFVRGSKLGQLLLLVGAGVVSLATLLTFSRGGVIALTVATSLSLGFYYLWGILDRRALWLVGAAGILLVLTLGIHGYEPLARKLATLRDSRSLDELSSGREALWGALLEAIPHFSRAGSGIGTHREVYPIFLEQYFPFEFSHGENGYLPLLLEAGAPGFVLMMIGVGYACFWAGNLLWRLRRMQQPAAAEQEGARHRHPEWSAERIASRVGWQQTDGPTTPVSPSQMLAGFWGALVPGLVASLVHSGGDFVWYISSCMALTVILLAGLCRTYQLARRLPIVESEPKTLAGNTIAAHAHDALTELPRGWWLVATVTVIGLALGLIVDRQRTVWAAPHYYDYLRLSLPAAKGSLGDEQQEQQRLEHLASHLREAVKQDPKDARINLKLAGVHLRLFDQLQRQALNPMPLSQIRDAAIASQFASREELQAWLDRAIGPNAQHLYAALQHSHRSLRACPLQGEGYIYLAELTFLEGRSTDAKAVYIEQAEKVRPHSGMVLFAKGQEAALEDNLPVAIACWQKAFAADPEIRQLLIETFAGRVPARFFLDQFSLDTSVCERLFRSYEPLSPAEASLIAQHYIQLAESEMAQTPPTAQAQLWLNVYRMHTYLGQADAALQAARKAVESSPQGIAERKTLAQELLRAQSYDEAAEHLAWCIRRAPDDAKLKQLLAETQRRQFQHQADASPPSPSPLR